MNANNVMEIMVRNAIHPFELAVRRELFNYNMLLGMLKSTLGRRIIYATMYARNETVN